MALLVGIKHLRDGIEPQAVLGAEMSVIGIVGTAPGADAARIPLNAPIEGRTNDTAFLTALGTTGTIPDAIAAISKQLSGVGAARVVVVRVAPGANDTATIANIVGSEANSSGAWALLLAPEVLGVTPRLLITPGFTHQTVQGVSKVDITAAGADGTNGTFALAFTGGTGAGAAGTFTVTDGSVSSITVTNPGSYTVKPTVSFSASNGLTGATGNATLAQVANGVCTVMPTICDRLKAFFLPEGPTSSRQAAVDWLETLPRSARIMHPLRQAAKVVDGEGETLLKPLSPYVVALYVGRDAAAGGVPAFSAANQSLAVQGVDPAIPFSITDENSVGQADLSFSFGIVFRGDLGSDGSLTSGGFGFWGTDTLSEDSQWLFASVGRMRDYLELSQVRALRSYLGRFNLTMQTVQAVLNTIETQLVRLRADGYILDYRLGFDPDANTPEQLRLGNIDLQFRAEEPPVLRKITLRSRRHREALTDLVRNIAVQLGSGV